MRKGQGHLKAVPGHKISPISHHVYQNSDYDLWCCADGTQQDSCEYESLIIMFDGILIFMTHPCSQTCFEYSADQSQAASSMEPSHRLSHDDALRPADDRPSGFKPFCTTNGNSCATILFIARLFSRYYTCIMCIY